jgi:hypothetical protein
VELGFPSVGDPVNSTGAGSLNHQTSKNSPILFWTKNSFLVYELQEFEGGIGIPKRGGPLNSTGAWLFYHQTFVISLNSFWRNISLWVF